MLFLLIYEKKKGNKTMKLLTKAIRNKLPKIGSTGEMKAENIPVTVKFFDPTSSWTWYATEGEPIIENGKEVDFMFFGMVHGHERELGYFRLSELSQVRTRFGLGIERDMYFGKHMLAEFM